jgi:hypothetical protein
VSKQLTTISKSNIPVKMINETKVVDFVVTSDKSHEVSLVIIDHLPWDEHEHLHLHLLQSKLNYYLGILESGELYQKFPKSKIYKVIIEVAGTYVLSKDAEEFYEKAKKAINGFGFELKFRMDPSRLH